MNSSRRETGQTHTSVHSINSSSSVKSVSPSAKLPKESLQTRTSTDTGVNNVTFPKPNPCLHAFYYAGTWKQTCHHYMPHWNPSVTKKYPQGRHVPPEDIGASFYPELGYYNSRDPAVITKHAPALVGRSGCGFSVVVPSCVIGRQGTTLSHGIKITLHIEPYIHTRLFTNWSMSILQKRVKSVSFP